MPYLLQDQPGATEETEPNKPNSQLHIESMMNSRLHQITKMQTTCKHRITNKGIFNSKTKIKTTSKINAKQIIRVTKMKTQNNKRISRMRAEGAEMEQGLEVVEIMRNKKIREINNKIKSIRRKSRRAKTRNKITHQGYGAIVK